MSALHTVTGIQRALGCVLGSAIGDALGAPFEFGPARAYSQRFPTPVLGGRGETIGGHEGNVAAKDASHSGARARLGRSRVSSWSLPRTSTDVGPTAPCRTDQGPTGPRPDRFQPRPGFAVSTRFGLGER